MVTIQKHGNGFRFTTTIGGRRLRGSLGTRDKRAATTLCSMLDVGLHEGPNSQVWNHLNRVLPPQTRQILSRTQLAPFVPALLADVERQFVAKLDKLEDCGQLSRGTVELYEKATGRFFDYLTSKDVRLMDEITPAFLENWQLDRIKELQTTAQATNSRSVLVDAAAIKRLLAFCYENKIIREAVAFPDTAPPSGEVEGAAPFTKEELAKLEAEVTRIGGVPLLAYLLLRWTGLRGSDTASLEWWDVDLNTGIIRKLTQKRKVTVIIPLAPPLKEALLRWETQMLPECSDRVLPNMTREKLYRLIGKIGTNCGIVEVHPHRFRSTFVVDLLERGIPIFEVSKIVGDSVYTLERAYAKFTDKMVERVREALEVA